MSKIKVLRQANFNTELLLTSLEKSVNVIMETKARLETEGWSGLHFKNSTYHSDNELEIWGMRYETDQEYNNRLKLEQKKQLVEQRKLERERIKYEVLKNKFEK